MNIEMTKTLSSFAIYGAIAILVGCGGATDSAPENAENVAPPAEEQDDTLVYNGPTAENDDVLNFKLYIWDLLAQEDRCGACHYEGGPGGGEPFVRRDDINLAYDAIQSYVDLEAPSNSAIYQRVVNDHNPWDGGADDTILNAINRWRTASGASATEIVLEPPSDPESVEEIFVFTDSAQSVFEATIYPLMTDASSANCNRCHAENTVQRQQPFHSSIDPEVAFSEVRSLIALDINNVAESQLVQKVLGGHETWPDPNPDSVLSPAEYSAQEMEQAIRDFLNGGAVEEREIPEEWIVSSAAQFNHDSSQIISAGGRVETNVIALYQFKEGEGGTAYDISGIDPVLHLDFTGNVEWLGSWGIRFEDNAIAKGNDIASRKLHEQIGLTSEYSVEAWVIPGNVTQEESRIVTYSGNDTERNFSLMQNIYDYDFYTRNENSDLNGEPFLNTPSGDELLQATLQHVVATYDPIDGRKIYVNGQLGVEDDEAYEAGGIADWDPTFPLSLGNELGSTDDWQGTIRFLAIHNRVLDEDQIRANFDAGVGQKYFMFFSVSEYVPYDEAFVIFTVELFDDNAYLFQEPFFMVMDEGAEITNPIAFEGMRIGINGNEAIAGQSFASINITVDSGNYSDETGARLWGDTALPYGGGDEDGNGILDGDEVAENPGPAGTVIAVENGVAEDVFFLTFERIGAETYTRPVEDDRPVPDILEAGEQPDIGVRMFDEIFHNMSALSTVPAARIYDFYSQEIRRSLPAAPDASSFLASQQSAITQLSLAYCNELIGDAALSSAYFGAIGDLSPDENDVDNISLVNALMDNMLIGLPGYSTGADVADVRRRLNNEGAAESADVDSVQGLIQALMTGANAVDSDSAATAVCTSVLASAAMLMQ
ncbi:MAG: LamG domain-containing protein [Agarilytica sp.]